VWEDYLCVTRGVYCCALVLGAVVLALRRVRRGTSKAHNAVSFAGDNHEAIRDQVGSVLYPAKRLLRPGKGAVEDRSVDRKHHADIDRSGLVSSPSFSVVARQLKVRISFQGTVGSPNGSASPTGAHTRSKQF
jgi:hypothetical protein